MRIDRRTLVYLLIGVGIFFGWKNLSYATQETALLYIPATANQDTYARVWFVNDGQLVWIRAENRTHWLKPLRINPNVELQGDDGHRLYRAQFFDTAQAKHDTDAKFREKYGVADQLRGLFVQRDLLPIRLERR